MTAPSKKELIPFFTRRTCPVCEEPFRVTMQQGRTPIYCSPECKKEGQADPRSAVRRHCHVCGKFHTVDMTDKMGSAPTYDTPRCKERAFRLAQFKASLTCQLAGCFDLVTQARAQFCTEAHRQEWIEAHPDSRSCIMCGNPTPIPANFRKPQRFCSDECREQFTGEADHHKAADALRDRSLTNRQRTQRFTKEGKKGRTSTKPHSYTMAMSHIEKLRWGLYPEPILVQILALGWVDEEEFFTTEDRWPPAVYEKIKDVPPDARAPVGGVVYVRDYGETEPRALAPDPAAPSAAEYKARARQIKADYEAETEAPAYVDAFRRSTGHNPERR